jgi:hypothetical protein
MSVYVDNMRRRANLTGRPANWSHLMADTTDELEAFARHLGLRPEWIQHAGTRREHYDVTDTVRAEAIRLGAESITYPHGTAKVLDRKRQAESELASLWRETSEGLAVLLAPAEPSTEQGADHG